MDTDTHQCEICKVREALPNLPHSFPYAITWEDTRQMEVVPHAKMCLPCLTRTMMSVASGISPYDPRFNEMMKATLQC